MSPYKEYRSDYHIDIEFEDDDDEEIECSCEHCNKPAERNGYCPDCNRQIQGFINFWRSLSNDCKDEIKLNQEDWLD